ncbi:hypothetical protein Tco_0754270 [Tanacetum coccineum]
MPGCSWRGHLQGVNIHYCLGVLGGDTCEGYIFITARVFLDVTPAMGTHGFHYSPGVLGGDTYDGYIVHRFHELRAPCSLNFQDDVLTLQFNACSSSNVNMVSAENQTLPGPRSSMSRYKRRLSQQSSLRSFMQMTSVHNRSGLVLHQMTSDHNRSELGIQDHSNEQSSSKLGSKRLEALIKKCMDKGSKERSPPHNLRQKPGQYICCQNHKLIADIKNDIMDPVMQCTTLLSHSGFSQQKLVSFVTEIHTSTNQSRA